jgi:hypothetical protein
MSYLALTKKKKDGEGKQRTRGYHLLLFFSGEQNGHLPFKRKGGHTAQTLKCKLVTKNTIINTM